MATVFLLQHLHLDANGTEEVKTIGLFSSRATALAAIKRLQVQPGFSAHPELVDPRAEGFSIDAYELDRASWSDGFIAD